MRLASPPKSYIEYRGSQESRVECDWHIAKGSCVKVTWPTIVATTCKTPYLRAFVLDK